MSLAAPAGEKTYPGPFPGSSWAPAGARVTAPGAGSQGSLDMTTESQAPG